MEEKLKAEYPQILCWLVQGAIRFLQEGLNIPDYIEAAAEEYRKDKDILGTFLNEFCTTEDFPAFRSNQKQEPAEILSTELYGAFAQWCLESNLRPYSAIVFKQRMLAKGFDYIKNSNIYIRGLRFQDGTGDGLYKAYLSRHRREFLG